jgi:Uma2 family endonuclease
MKNMANTLVKLFDDEEGVEEYILVDEEDVEKVKQLLEEYRKDNPDYDIEGFLELLDVNGIDYESLPVEKVYF